MKTSIKSAVVFSVFTLFFSFIAKGAPPSLRKYSDKHGNIVALEYKFSNGHAIYRDKRGRVLGYSTPAGRNSTIYSNRHGSYMYRQTIQGKSKNSTFYGRSGNTIGHSTNKTR